MKKIIFLLLLSCFTGAANGQNIKIYVQDGCMTFYPTNGTSGPCVQLDKIISIRFDTVTNYVHIVRTDNTIQRLAGEIKKQNGTSYSTSAKSVRDSLTKLLSQNVSIASLNQKLSGTLGANRDSVFSITSSSTIYTKASIRLIIQNTGSANGTVTYGGVSRTVTPGSELVFFRDFDQVSKKYSDFATLVLNGTGTTLLLTKKAFQ